MYLHTQVIGTLEEWLDLYCTEFNIFWLKSTKHFAANMLIWDYKKILDTQQHSETSACIIPQGFVVFL